MIIRYYILFFCMMSSLGFGIAPEVVSSALEFATEQLPREDISEDIEALTTHVLLNPTAIRAATVAVAQVRVAHEARATAQAGKQAQRFVSKEGWKTFVKVSTLLAAQFRLCYEVYRLWVTVR